MYVYVCVCLQATQAHQALPDHEKQTEALKDLDELRPRIKTSAVFRRKKAKVRGEADMACVWCSRHTCLCFSTFAAHTQADMGPAA